VEIRDGAIITCSSEWYVQVVNKSNMLSIPRLHSHSQNVTISYEKETNAVIKTDESTYIKLKEYFSIREEYCKFVDSIITYRSLSE
jgi:hypothetical protein